MSSSWKTNLNIIVFTLTRTAINTSYRMVYPFLPVFARGLDVEPATLALAFSVRSFLGVFGPFLATVADTHDRRTGMLLGIGLFTAGSGIAGIWPGLFPFVTGTTLILLGNVVFIPSMNAFLGDHIPYERRGRLLAVTEISWALAAFAGIPLVRILIERVNWMAPFVVFAVVGAITFIFYLWFVPAEKVTKSAENTLWRNLGRVLGVWPALAGLLAGILFTGANETVNIMFGVWIEGQFGLDFAALTMASVVIGLSELGGEGVSWLWLDAIGKRRMIWIFLGLNSLAALLLPLTSGSLSLSMAGLGFFFITFEVILVSALTLMSEVVPDARATMMAVTISGFSVGRMLGDLIAPGLYALGFWACCLMAVGLNVLASILLTQVKVGKDGQALKATTPVQS